MRKKVSSKLFQEHIKDWLYSIIERLETEYHKLDSLCKLKNYINDVEKTNEVSVLLIAFMRNYILSSFVLMLLKLSFRHYMHKGMGMIDHNYFSKSENSTLSQDYTSSKPNNRLHVACDSIINHIDKRYSCCLFIFSIVI